MMQQLSMLDLMMPPSAPVVAKPYVAPPRRDFMTRAYGVKGPMSIRVDEEDPIEVEVRGIPTLIRFGFGWSTYTIQPAGSTYWSETGFRSFGGPQTDGLEIAEIIARHIDDKHGCNGKLTKWWPSYCLQWRQDKRFGDHFDRATTWDQWGPEKHKESWDNFDARQAAALERMAAEGIDPNEVWRTRR
ncbi:hypothetical protein A6U87_14920 [Rhizobium sp. AC44/96]|uniref:hypothetical protein n=1 Tax=Rhizobium sp. AC44/96 TaxID=1841654 RepID=UPI000810138C|nr:hypothetical protein [Rhizobium sp. AC44/96]OCJ05293.1 hypothetical protein A6U87_14920 [Rhizobium sp. AC44/96]